MAREFRLGPWLVQPNLNTISRNGTVLRLEPKVLDVLVYLAERRGEVVPKEELIKAVWSDAFVTDDTLTRCVYELRKVLEDDVKHPRFIQTVPRRGYRLIPSVEEPALESSSISPDIRPHVADNDWRNSRLFSRRSLVTVCGTAVLVSLLLAWFWWGRVRLSVQTPQRALTRLTFEPGLQTGPSWSPDGRMIAYSSNQIGKFDIWVQQIGSGGPLQITHDPGQNWQPEWSPDGKYIAYRSENGEGGLYTIPALGGVPHKIAGFGYYPRWSPDSTQILFQPTSFGGLRSLYTVSPDGGEPKTVLDQFFAEHPEITGRSAAWHPDGKRVSVYIWDYKKSAPVFWTVPLKGGEAVKSEVNPEQLKHFGDTSTGRFAADTRFSWNPSGSAIYFERTFAGATNLWKMRVDPKTLQVMSIERLTTGPGYDSGLSISPDGKKLAFSGESRRVQIWVAPFDPESGRLTGNGEVLTSPGIEAWIPTLTPDGQKLAFSGSRGRGWQVWQKSLISGVETLIADDSYIRAYPVWSPNGKFLAYARINPSGTGNSLMTWSADSGEETVIGDGRDYDLYGWSPDNQQLVVSKWNEKNKKAEVWLLPIDSKLAPQKITASPDYFLFQGQVSPDGRWVAFEAIRDVPKGRESTVYVVLANGGPWIRVTDSQQWDDKPRWSLDGKTIYFVSSRGGFYNVWGKHFDLKTGKVGSPFRVTDFNSPGLMVPNFIPDVGLSVAATRLAVTVSQSSGGIWILDNVAD